MGGKPSYCNPPCKLLAPSPTEPGQCVCPRKETFASDACLPPCHMKSDIMGGPDVCACPGSMEYFGGHPKDHQSSSILPFILIGGALLLAWYLMNKKRR